MGCETCRRLLNEALNLSVRSEIFEEQRRRQAALDTSNDPDDWEASGRFASYIKLHNLRYPHAKIAEERSHIHLWVYDQYDKDLSVWQEKARAHLTQGCSQ